MLLATATAFSAIGPAGEAGLSPRNDSPALTEAKVVGPDNKPLAGVQLSIQPRPGLLTPEKITETSVTLTDAAGALPQLPPEVPGVYYILRKAGYETRALDASRPLAGTIAIQPGRTISGAVFSADGQPISGAIAGPVTYTAHSDRQVGRRQLTPRVAVRTSSDGTFKLEGMPLQPVTVQFWAPGYQARTVEFSANDNEQKIALNSGGAIAKGTVVGSKDRSPQPAIPVEAAGQGVVVYSVTDDKGNYIIDNLSTGTWNIRPVSGGPLSGTQSRAVTVQVDQANQTLDVPLVLNQGIMLAGRAIDAATSRGLAGINITLAGYQGTGAKAVLTEPDGSFSFENLDSLQDVVIRFDPLKFVYLLPNGAYRDYFDINTAFDTNFDITTMTLPLYRRLPIQGKVTDAAGQAVPDVQVHMQALSVVSSAPSKSGRSLLDFVVKSNGNGDFQGGVYPPGKYKVWAQQEELVSQVETVDVFTTSAKPVLSLKLNQAATLDGVVTDANDQPVTNAIVIAWPTNAPEPEEDPIPGRDNYRFAKTGKGGHFQLKELRGEPMNIRATHRNYLQPINKTLDPAAVAALTSPGLILKFPAGGEISVTVLDDAGQPLSHAEVGLDYRIGLDGHRASVLTDVRGHAMVGSIPATKLDKVTITHPMYATFESPGPVTLPATGYVIQLKKRGSVIANVKGESLLPGVPLEVFLLKAPAGAGDRKEPAETAYEQIDRAAVTAGQAVFRSLPEGWYKVAFADSGAYAESEPAEIVAGGGDKTVELTVPKGNHLVGKVLDKNSGKGLAGANVTISPTVNSQIVAERATQNTTTGEDGLFEFYNVGAGTLHVKAIAANYPDFERNIKFAPGQPFEVPMTNTPATLSGKVTAAGAPVSGALLILTTNGGDHSPVATASSESDGSYKMEGFAAGSYTLSIEAPIGEGENISRKNVAVELEGGEETKNIEFAALVNVHGRVTLDGKTPSRRDAGPVTLLFRGMDQGAESKMVQIREDGSYTTQLEPGNYQVSLEDREGREITISNGSSQQLDLGF